MIKTARSFIIFTIINSAILLATDCDESDCSSESCWEDYPTPLWAPIAEWGHKIDLDNFPLLLLRCGPFKDFSEQDMRDYWYNETGLEIRTFWKPEADFTPQRSKPLKRRNTWQPEAGLSNEPNDIPDLTHPLPCAVPSKDDFEPQRSQLLKRRNTW